MFATSLALLSNAFHGRDRGTAFGVFGAVTGIAVAVGPVVGGALVSGSRWRWIFLVNIPVGIAALIITLRQVEESRDPHARRVDFVGLVTFSAGLAALVYGLIRSNEDGWGSSTCRARWSRPPCCSSPSWSPRPCSASRCSTSRCCASRRSSAA